MAFYILALAFVALFKALYNLSESII